MNWIKYITPVLLILSLWACDGTKTKDTKCIQTTHLSENQLALNKAPQRIISCAPAITEIIYALHEEHRLVGRTNYCSYPEAAQKVESIGGLIDPCIECILHLKPDLVIASTHFKQTAAKRIKELGLPFTWLISQESISGAGEQIKSVGELIGVKNKADSLWNSLQEHMNKTIASIPQNTTKPKVYYVLGFGKQGDHTAGGNTFIHELITKAGGINIAADVKGWSYNLEALIQADPDIILIQKQWEESFCQHDHYKDLRAVKNKQVFTIDHHMIQLNGPRIHLALRTFANIFYPQSSL